MNEYEGIMDELLDNEKSNVTESTVVESPEENGETSEEPAQTTENGSSEYGVDTGEILETESAQSELILEEVQYQNELLETIIEIQTKGTQTIFEKPIAEYNAIEGMALTIILILFATIIITMVGGIIKWRE